MVLFMARGDGLGGDSGGDDRDEETVTKTYPRFGPEEENEPLLNHAILAQRRAKMALLRYQPRFPGTSRPILIWHEGCSFLLSAPLDNG